MTVLSMDTWAEILSFSSHVHWSGEALLRVNKATRAAVLTHWCATPSGRQWFQQLSCRTPSTPHRRRPCMDWVRSAAFAQHLKAGAFDAMSICQCALGNHDVRLFKFVFESMSPTYPSRVKRLVRHIAHPEEASILMEQKEFLHSDVPSLLYATHSRRDPRIAELAVPHLSARVKNLIDNAECFDSCGYFKSPISPADVKRFASVVCSADMSHAVPNLARVFGSAISMWDHLCSEIIHYRAAECLLVAMEWRPVFSHQMISWLTTEQLARALEILPFASYEVLSVFEFCRDSVDKQAIVLQYIHRNNGAHVVARNIQLFLDVDDLHALPDGYDFLENAPPFSHTSEQLRGGIMLHMLRTTLHMYGTNTEMIVKNNPSWKH